MASDPSQFSRDFYQSAELWGGWNIHKKWQLLAFVPYNLNRQVSDEGTNNRNGLGDISAMINYKILDKASVDHRNRLVTQKLWLGTGIKLPTGKFSIDPLDPDLAASANTQIGSGSLDFLVTANYTIQLNKFGINTSLLYKFNSNNSIDYRFGNKNILQTIAYYVVKTPKTILTPNLGVLYERAADNKLQHNIIGQTGGWLAMASGGVEMSRGKISIGGNLQAPLLQDFASGQTHSRLRGMLHISHSF